MPKRKSFYSLKHLRIYSMYDAMLFILIFCSTAFLAFKLQNSQIPIFKFEAIVLNYLPPKSHLYTRTVPFLGIIVTIYCEESLLFKSPITNHTLEVPFINYVLLQCMYFVFQNNASSFASEEKSSTRGMMSRDRFQILKLFFLTISSNTTKIAPTSASFDSNKYQGAKAISSADLFGDEPVSSQSTPQSRLSQFSGASGVGSSDIFGNGNSSSASYSGYNIR
jgi:hypothetical protein